MIAPVFAYRWQFWLFFTSLAFFLALPFLPKPDWMDRGILYRSITFNKHNKNNIHAQLINDTKDIDILFLGASSLASSINPLNVKAALKALTGEDKTVLMAYHPQAGFDYDYIILKDILQKRKVKFLIWDGLRPPGQDAAKLHFRSPHLWDMYLHKPIIQMFSFDSQIGVYLFSVMTGMKLALSPLLPQGALIPENEEDFLCDKEYYLGACLRNEVAQVSLMFPLPPTLSMDRLLHYRETSPLLRTSARYRRLDGRLFQKVLELAKEHDIEVALAISPVLAEAESVIPIQRIPPYKPGWNLPIIGATRYDAFHSSGVPDDQFYQPEDGTHMLYNATNYYTQLVLPAILELYKQAATTGILTPERMLPSHLPQEYPDEYDQEAPGEEVLEDLESEMDLPAPGEEDAPQEFGN